MQRIEPVYRATNRAHNAIPSFLGYAETSVEASRPPIGQLFQLAETLRGLHEMTASCRARAKPSVTLGQL
jgi:hypothetical protein